MMCLVWTGAIGTLLSAISTSHHVPCLLRVSHLSRLAWNCVHERLSWMMTLLRALVHHHGCAPTRTWKSAVWLLPNVLRWPQWEMAVIGGVVVDDALVAGGAGKKLVNTSLELATLA